jgi:pyridoxal phosphate enzyme (YggS family)
MESISKRLAGIKNKLQPYGATLVAVSKFRPLAELEEVLAAGHMHLGENRVQEMVEKHEALANPAVRWHQIGTLQRNKAKYIAPFVHLVHAMDSMELLIELEKQARKAERQIPFLLQISIAQEETKHGLTRQEVETILESPVYKGLEYLKLQGLMGMATNTEDQAQVAAEFKGLRLLFEELQAAGQPMHTLSMGMSQDWELALEHGSTMVRIGSALFVG